MIVATELRVVEGTSAELAEAPSWDDASRSLLWVDMSEGTILRYWPERGIGAPRHVRQPLGFVVPCRAAGLIASSGRDFFAVDDDGIRRLASLADGSPHGARLNDGKCDSRGRIWTGTAQDPAQPLSGALYRMDPDLGVHRMLGGVAMSNGIGWSPDDQAMYFVDSLTGAISVFDADVDKGEIENRRTFVSIDGSAGLPDGLTVDAEGCVWVALWGGWRVQRYSPTGVLCQEVELPVAQVTSCAFGGNDLSDLYVTTARAGLTDAELRTQPLAGAIFKIATNVRGLPASAFGTPPAT